MIAVFGVPLGMPLLGPESQWRIEAPREAIIAFIVSVFLSSVVVFLHRAREREAERRHGEVMAMHRQLHAHLGIQEFKLHAIGLLALVLAVRVGPLHLQTPLDPLHGDGYQFWSGVAGACICGWIGNKLHRVHKRAEERHAELMAVHREVLESHRRLHERLGAVLPRRPLG